MSQQTRMVWLKVACVVLIGFGLLSLTGSLAATGALGRIFADLAFWPLDGLPGNAVPEVRLLWAINSGCLVGWGLLIWQLVTRLYPREPALARSMILISIGAWFLLDSGGSILAGAPMNALYNVGFLLLFYVPLLGSRSEQSNQNA
ncbi:MAG: hypothetical protein Kilf2KO_03390 [Rhodospirillales bacterium]